MVTISMSKFKDLQGNLQDNLSGTNATFYGLAPSGERRCLEEETLYQYEAEHDYRSGAIVMRDGTRMATTQAKAREKGWTDLADMMAARGKP